MTNWRSKLRHQQTAPGPRRIEPVRKERVLIAVPSEEETFHIAVHNFIQIAHRMSLHPEFPFHFEHSIKIGERPIPYARNRLVGDFLRSKCERLWFIDADMIPPPELFALLNIDADIVAPRMLALKRDDAGIPRLEICAFKYNLKNDSKFNAVVPTGPVGLLGDIDAVGTGCTLIKRRVLEDERMWLAPEYEWPPGHKCDLREEPRNDRWAPPLFRMQYKPNGEHLRGEDLDFCLRAKALGYKVATHLGFSCGHSKTMNLDDMANYVNACLDRAQKNQAAQPAEVPRELQCQR
ncbi:MAG: hypothetical protein KBA95_12650 [Acidobacteria bacterium]|nr:hypothetical protein [Acidobacteriota bacterium]